MRIAILVEHAFLDHHVGVRNYLFSLATYLTAAGEDVRFVSAFHPYSHTPNWFRVHLPDPRFLVDNGIRDDWRIAGPAGLSLGRYFAEAPAKLGSVARPSLWYSQIGPRLDTAGFDVLVVGNPWLVDFEARLPVPRQVGVVYDAIPSRFCFAQDAKPFEFAAQHVKGFRYFRDRCDATLAISDAVAADLVELFGFDPGRVGAFPPMVPPNCLRPAGEAVKRRPGAVLLASPLDLRKGLRAMPGLIGPAGGAVSTLLMYGGVRCPEADLHAFFAALPPDLLVEWYPRATAATTERLFREAELLLFPSESEGLGLPLIEAQLRGCPAVARPVRPMSDLLVPGSRTLPGTAEEDAALVREMLADTAFDHAAFEARARRFFGTDALPARVAAAVAGG